MRKAAVHQVAPSQEEATTGIPSPKVTGNFPLEKHAGQVAVGKKYLPPHSQGAENLLFGSWRSLRFEDLAAPNM